VRLPEKVFYGKTLVILKFSGEYLTTCFFKRTIKRHVFFGSFQN